MSEEAKTSGCEQKVAFDQQIACDTCGRFGAFEFDGKRLCTDCYESHGSCCPEFGADDLWPKEESGSGKKDV